MSIAERIADGIATHSKAVLVVLLLVTAVVGAGATLVDDQTSLDQFESDSPEGEAATYVEENFTLESNENQTTVQVITRGGAGEENVLTRESLVNSLRFQQAVRDNETVNETLADDDAIVGVENLVATTAYFEERASDLEDRGEELEDDAEDLEGDRATLENETAALSAALNETADRQADYEELNASLAAGEIDQATYEAEAAEIEASMDAVVADATADLDATETERFEAAVEQVRTLTSQRVELEASGDADEERLAELDAQLDGAYQQGTVGVFEEEFEDLQDRADDLEARQIQLEDEREDLEDDDGPDLDGQIETLESADRETFEDARESVLSESEGDDQNESAGGDFALQLLPSGYDPGSTSAEARMTFVTQETAGETGGGGPGGVSDEVVESQLALRDLADETAGDHVVFGAGILTDEIERSMGDSLAMVGPLALVFVAAALAVAYRDPLDIVLGLAGIAVVLLLTFGFMGWADIAFNQMMVAVPVLLIGLAIDYAIHVFMRHRERRTEVGAADASAESVRDSMGVALAGVGVALVWVTVTTAIGFLANVSSAIAPIREFGVVSAFGILAALVVFAALVPATKVELDSFLESRGYDRRKRAFGTGEGALSEALSVGAVAARKAPLAVLALTLLVTAGGVYGAANVDTAFEEEDFLAEEPPAWTESLPGPMEPGEYRAAADLDYVNERFQREGSEAEILVRGEVTDPATLERIDDAEADLAEGDAVYTLATGEADVTSPLSVMEEVADENESFNESFVAADDDGDGIPDEDLEPLYDDLLEADETAAEVIYLTDDGEYEAVRVTVAVEGDAGFGEITEETRAAATTIDGDDPDLTATATGDPVVSYVVEQDLFDTVIETLLVTLVAVVTFLTLAYRISGNSATLGAITLVPVAFAVSWILGSMYLLGLPFNVLTGMITSLTVGLGVAYCIHVSSRYTLELERQGNVWAALETTVTGTGGALVGSAATTIGGFGVLVIAILPVLEQFGLVTALTILYAFLASVLVLPTLLVLWTRYLGPDVSFATGEARRGTDARPASDGGGPADGRGREDE